MRYRLIAVLLLSVTLIGCASLAIPRMPNLRSYEPATCDPVLSIHIPLSVAKIHEYGLIVKDLKDSTILLDKVVSTGQIDALGRNGAQLGSAGANIVSAFKDNLSMTSIISGAALGLVTGVTDARSEDKTQDRIDVCKPKGDEFLYIRGEDVAFLSMKTAPANLDFLKDLDRSKT